MTTTTTDDELAYLSGVWVNHHTTARDILNAMVDDLDRERDPERRAMIGRAWQRCQHLSGYDLARLVAGEDQPPEPEPPPPTEPAANLATFERVASEARRLAIDDRPTTSRKRRRLARPVCHEVAPILTHKLQAAGIEAREVIGWVLMPYGEVLRHHWTEAEGMVIDVTIDQLGEHWPAILIAPVEEMRDFPWGRYTTDATAMAKHVRGAE